MPSKMLFWVHTSTRPTARTASRDGPFVHQEEAMAHALKCVVMGSRSVWITEMARDTWNSRKVVWYYDA